MFRQIGFVLFSLFSTVGYAASQAAPQLPAPVVGQQVQVQIFTPQGEAHPVRQVAVRFSEAVVRLGDSKVYNPFKIGCAMSGKGRWLDGRNWVYDFDRDLPAGIACQFVPVAGLKAVSGRLVADRQIYRFQTAAPSIVDMRPYEAAEDIDENQVFLLKFDGENDRKSLPQSFYCLIENIKEKVPLQFLSVEETQKVINDLADHDKTWWKERESIVEQRAVRCSRQLPPNAKVKLVLDKGLASLTGVIRKEPQILSFKVRPVFSAAFSCTRENARQGCAPMMPMQLNFSDFLPAQYLKAIRLESAGKTWLPQLSEENESDARSLSFLPPFPPNSTFTLILPDKLQDIGGRPLSNAVRFPLKVTTANYPPLAKFASNFGVIEAASGAVPVTLRRLEPAGGVSPEAHLYTLKLPDSDREIVQWISRFQQHQQTQECYRCGDRDDQGKLLQPDPRSVSLLAKNPKAKTQTLPRKLAEKEFEVVGIPVDTGIYIHEIESQYLGESLIGNKSPMYVSALSIVTNLGVHLRNGPQGGEVWVTSLDRAEPVPSAKVSLIDCKTGASIWQGSTDKNGLASLKVDIDLSDYDESCGSRYILIAHAGADRAILLPRWSEGIESWRFNLPGWQKSGDLVAHTVLDRTLLRAGEILHMRHFIRRATIDNLQAPHAETYKRLYLQHQGSGQEYDLPIAIDSNGNGENTWKIPRSVKLGAYVLRLETGKTESELASFRVEEFRLPVLKAFLQLPKDASVAASSLPVDIQLQYINGGGFSHAPIVLRGSVSPLSADVEAFPDYTFSSATSESVQNTQTLEEKSLVLDGNGALRTQTAALPKIASPSRLTVEMQYRDPSGETHTALARTSLWPASTIAGIKLPEWGSGTQQGEPQKIEVITLGKDNHIQANVAVQIKAEMRIRQSHRRRTVGGFYAYESTEKVSTVPLSCPTKSAQNGRLSCQFTPKGNGEFVVYATTKDDQGRLLTTKASTWLSDGGRNWFDQGNDDRIDLIPSKKEYAAGENMQLQVRMPFPEATALISIERDGILQSVVQKISANHPVIELPVKAEYAPNVFVSALLVRGRNSAVAPTALVDLGKPAFKLGIAEVKVGWSAWRLGVDVKTDKSRYQPRENAQVNVQVSPPSGQNLPVNTEVTVAAVDEALLELADNDTWDVLKPMMQERGHDVDTATSQLQVVGKRHYGRKALPPGGGGGRGRATRELFDTLIFWQARAKVNADGKATFSVPLNDSLTKFKIVAVASSQNRFGTGSAEIESFQEVSLLSGLPLVVRKGDQLDPVFTVRNAGSTEKILNFRASISGLGTVLEKNIKVKAGEAEPVAVPFTVPDNQNSLAWTVAVTGDTANDRLVVTQRVLDPVPEQVLQATVFQLATPMDIPVQKPANILDGGGLQITAQARLSDSLKTVKTYFQDYPYSCLEQKTSRAVGLQDRALWDEMMEVLPSYLDENGLAAFYPNSAGYPFLTDHILRLSKVTAWPIPDAQRNQMLDALTNYVEGKLAKDDWRMGEWDETHRRLEAITTLSQYGRFKSSWLDTLKIQPARWTTSMLVNWLTLLKEQANISQRTQKLAQTENLLRARLTRQGSVYSLSEGQFTHWWLYDNDEATLARLIIATMDMPAWQEDQPRLMRGLLMRQKAGRWSTTLANLWGGQALRLFSERFEHESVSGSTHIVLSDQKKDIEWQSSNLDAVRLNWPDKPATLLLTQEGEGKPWVTVQSRARKILSSPESTGFTVTKTLKPLQQKVAGQWSVGDVVQVRLKMSAQSDMGWVVLDDPIPAGSTLLGRALGRDQSLVAENNAVWTWATFAEFAADSYRAYYENIYKGEWEAVYTVRLNQSGTFLLPPTRVEAMYAPEMYGLSPNKNVVVNP